AYGLPCRWLLLTVGPKYKDKYYIAAQNTLNACYRECLQLLVESGLRTIAIPCCWYSKGYPLEEQAHVALRTLRRCLERLRGSVDAVVLVAANTQEAELYDSLMPLYFPRTAGEANDGAAVLPDSCWNEWGEVTVEERRIRVSSSLISGREDDDDEPCNLFSEGDDSDRAFLHAREDADNSALRRLEGTMIEATSEEEAKQAFFRYHRRARDLRPDPEAMRFVYTAASKDRFGRHVVVLLGARLPALGVRDERTLPMFLKELELLRNERFILLYINSEVAGMDTVTLEVLQEMLAVISARYRTSLGQLLVLHPGLWFRAAFVLGRAVSDDAASLWHDSLYLEANACWCSTDCTFASATLHTSRCLFHTFERKGGGGGKKIPNVPADFTVDPEARYAGKVTYYNKWKGYGFVEMSEKGLVPEDRVFVQWRNIQSEDRFPFLVKDMEVELGLMKWTERGGWSSGTTLRAKTVTMPGGALIALQNSVDAEKKSFVGGQDLRYTGKLKFYDPRAGFGYVSLDPGFTVEEGVPGDLRVERAEVNAGARQPIMMDNMDVEFGIWKTRRGAYKVYNMTLPGGIAMTQEVLEHRAVVSQESFAGEVSIWNYRQGWGFIKAAAGVSFPAAVQEKLAQQTQSAQSRAEKRGKTTTQEELLYFRRGDLKQGVRLESGNAVSFQLYTDDKGAGACEIQLSA
ncbi:unnamed protein product, partial [Polarella glacialis]